MLNYLHWNETTASYKILNIKFCCWNLRFFSSKGKSGWRSGHQSRLPPLLHVVCGLSFSRFQPDFEGFLRALRFRPSSKSIPIWRVCLSVGIWFPSTTLALTKFRTFRSHWIVIQVQQSKNSKNVCSDIQLQTAKDKTQPVRVMVKRGKSIK